MRAAPQKAPSISAPHRFIVFNVLMRKREIGTSADSNDDPRKEQARIGHGFVYLGPGAQYQDCRIKAACLNQSPLRRYRVVKLRDVVHDCVLSGDVVMVVEIKPSAPPASLDFNSAREGSTMVYQSSGCLELSCNHYSLCHPGGLVSGQRIHVLEVGDRLNCALGRDLVVVKVAYSSE